MNVHNGNQPYLALVDDDVHSARLLTRMLIAHGAPSVKRFGGAEAGIEQFRAMLAEPHPKLPGLVIVDLKSSSGATKDFVVELNALENADMLVIAAMAQSLERPVRDELLDAGADAVFERHAEINAYRREAASIVSFWVRNQRLQAVGT